MRTPTDIDTRKRTRTRTPGRRRTDMDSDEHKSAFVPSVGGRIVQTRPALKRTFKDLRDVLYTHVAHQSRNVMMVVGFNPSTAAPVIFSAFWMYYTCTRTHFLHSELGSTCLSGTVYMHVAFAMPQFLYLDLFPGSWRMRVQIPSKAAQLFF